MKVSRVASGEVAEIPPAAPVDPTPAEPPFPETATPPLPDAPVVDIDDGLPLPQRATDSATNTSELK
jgi:hypothetical protein